MSDEVQIHTQWYPAAHREWMYGKEAVEVEFENGEKRIIRCPRCGAGKHLYRFVKQWRYVNVTA